MFQPVRSGELNSPACGRAHSAPPYCPELNPIERLWEHIKAALKWTSFKTLAQLQTKVDPLIRDLTPEVIASITGYSFIMDAQSALNPFKSDMSSLF
ncbi:MAG: transposase [Waterburya sp.]